MRADVLPAGPQSAPGVAGQITLADRVVERIAARVAADVPDVGGGSGGLGRRIGLGQDAELGSLPQVRARVEEGVAELRMDISVRWTASVADVTEAVRAAVRDRVLVWTGVRVEDVTVTVTDLLVPPPAGRVR